MKMYKLHVDMYLILPRLKKFRLGDYNSVTAIVFVEAKSADDACGIVWDQFVDMIQKQDNSTETNLLLKDLKDDFKVMKVYVP
jgi:hypothetical protein